MYNVPVEVNPKPFPSQLKSEAVKLLKTLTKKAQTGSILTISAILLCMTAGLAQAHEFWLEPSDYAPPVGASIDITHRNGQFFKGNSYPYIRDWFKSFEVHDTRGKRAIKGIQGNDPAATLKMTERGLTIVTYHGTPDLLRFSNWEKFTTYLKSEGQPHILAQHRARGLSETAIKESYSRCAKVLIAVGEGKGHDRATGMPIELIAQDNPYTLPAGKPLRVRLLLRGKPAAGLTIKVFAMANRKAPKSYITDANGRATIPLPHKGAYLLNAVTLFEPPADMADKYEWESLWASMTFERR